MFTESDFRISEDAYRVSYRVMTALRRRLGINIKLHDGDDLLQRGEIFLFNHFARFETLIPQYFIWEATGAYSRSITSQEILARRDRLARYLMSVGGVPTNYPRLLPFLAAEILRGRKVIVFPEGGMVKDRRVVDDKGEYSVFSRIARTRRKHHMGAAVLAMMVEAVRRDLRRTSSVRLQSFADRLGMTPDALRAAIHRPTLMVPANITFYPVRIADNILRRSLDLFAEGIHPRVYEELLIEANLLLERTDMDIRLGSPIRAEAAWSWWERPLGRRVLGHARDMDHAFEIAGTKKGPAAALFARRLRRHADTIRNRAMRDMYAQITVNLSHLAAGLITALLDDGETEVSERLLRRALYHAVAEVRSSQGVHRHRGLDTPDHFIGLVGGICEPLDQLLDSVVRAGLVERDEGTLRFLPNLRADHAFDRIRLDNPLAVYANEAAPMAAVKAAVAAGLSAARDDDGAVLSGRLLADEKAAALTARLRFAKPRYSVINSREELAADAGKPLLMVPENPSPLGVLLVHGFLATPAEMVPLARVLAGLGHPVFAVRMAGHGTSPWDLAKRDWPEWLAGLRRGLRVLAPYAQRICAIGTSLGGMMALHLAAEQPRALAGVAAVSLPLHLKTRALIEVPVVHGARWLLPVDRILPFSPNTGARSAIEYASVPTRAVHQMVAAGSALAGRFPDIECPVAVIHAADDPVADVRVLDTVAAALPDAEVHRLDGATHHLIDKAGGPAETWLRAFLADRAAGRGVPRRLSSVV